MRKQSKVVDILVLAALTIVSLAVLMVLESNLFTTKVPVHFNQLSSGWSVKIGENEYNDVRLSDFDSSKVRKGEIISFTRELPTTGLKSPAIMFLSSYCVVEVYKDGELIYSYGRPTYERGKYVEKSYNLVSLGECRTPHELTISYLITENNVVKNFQPVYFGTKKELITFFFQNHRTSMFVGGFFFIYAFILVALGLYLLMCGKVDTSVYISAMLSLLLGTYTFTYNDILCFVGDRDILFSDLEYISMYLMPLAVLILLHVTHPNIGPKIQKFLGIVNVCIPLIFFACHYSGLVNFAYFVTFFQVVLIIENLLLIPALLRGLGKAYKKHKENDIFVGFSADNYLTLGYIILLIFMFLEIIKYNIIKNNVDTGSFSLSGIHMLDLGFLGFMICLFVYYFLSSIEHMNASRVKEELEGLAFTDNLTGLMNRAKCMQYAYSLDEPYAVIILDLDRLKKINDTYGHLEGDKMIMAFADLLKKAFRDADLVGRTGGDEFMIVYDKPKEGVCEKGLEYLQLLVNDYNNKEAKKEKFTLSYSSGYAYSHETPEKDFKFSYYLADSRMYKMKETHHA